MKNIALPVICLLVGGVAGYSLRGVSAGSDGPTAHIDSVKAKSAAGKANDPANAGTAHDDTALSAGLSLADQMKEILVDFDMKSAQKAVKKLSTEELKSALALLAAMPKGSDRDALRRQLYYAWGILDPQAAWKAAMADSSDKETGLLLGAVASAVAKTNPSAAIVLAMSLSMGGKRSTVLNSVFTEWSKVDVAAAIAYSNSHPDQPIDSFSFSSGLRQLAEKDPLKAANLAISFKDEMRRNSMLSSLMGAWVDRDPAAALKWAQSQTNPQLRQDATASAVGAWAKADPAAALAYVQTISDGETRTSSFKKAWGDWFRANPAAAAAYLATTTDEKLLQSVRFEFSYYSDSLSAKERASLLAKIPEGKMKDEIYRTMTGIQIRNGKFNEALSMLNSMPDSNSRDRSVAELGQAWAKTDLAAASAWLKIQPNSTDRDLALAGYASTLARSDPTSAINWVNTIPDAKLREGAKRNIAARWYKSDPVKADAWMAENRFFSESDKKRIRTFSSDMGDYLPFSLITGERR
ncbi:MAG: hypothetical protein ABL974_18470 [Prosthecobacter sp.]